MKALVVVGHPAPGSFNRALGETIAAAWTTAGCEVAFHDLVEEDFDPRLTAGEARGERSADPLVLAHIAALRGADLLGVVHPNLWGAPLAVMKGWIDRVFALNAAYTFAKGDDRGDEPIGLLKLRAALVVNTGNTPMAREQATFGDPLDRIWRDCILGFCGSPRVARVLFGVVATSTLAERQGWLAETRRLAEEAVEACANQAAAPKRD